MTLTEDQIELVIKKCKEAADKGIVSIRKIINTEIDGITMYTFPGYSQVEEIAHRIRLDSRYSISINPQDPYDFHVTPNTNYELERSVIATNENVRSTNNLSVNLASKMNLFTAATAFFALCSVIVAIFQCNMSKTDKPIPELQRLDTTLQSQARELDSLKQTLRTVDSVLVRIADSLSMK